MTFVDQIITDFKNIEFKPSDKFRWSPEDNVIFFNPNLPKSSWSLLHEIGHVLCNHKSYNSDIGLIKMETQAWQKAREIAKKYKLKTDENHIEKCLDSYRNWLYRRSSCPKCSQAGIEKHIGIYSCINCKNKWSVTTEKFCRVYRKTVTA